VAPLADHGKRRTYGEKYDFIRRKYATLFPFARIHFTHSATQFTHSATQPDICFGAGERNHLRRGARSAFAQVDSDTGHFFELANGRSVIGGIRVWFRF
jgi:hypothetical protein